MIERRAGVILMPQPVQIGSPDRGDLVHLHVTTPRPGMCEGVSATADYTPQAVCGYGSWHKYLCDDIQHVTCPRCLERCSVS